MTTKKRRAPKLSPDGQGTQQAGRPKKKNGQKLTSETGVPWGLFPSRYLALFTNKKLMTSETPQRTGYSPYVPQWSGPCQVSFFVFWRSKGRGAMPQGHENKGNKTIRQKEKQKARVTYRVKRPPKWEGAPPYGASPPTSPGNRTPPPY